MLTNSNLEVPIPSNFFQFNLDKDKGEILSSTNFRVSLVEQSYFSSLVKVLKDSEKDIGDNLLYKIGVDFGKKFYKIVELQLLHKYQVVQDIPLYEYVSIINQTMVSLGFGNLSLVEEFGYGFVDLHSSVFLPDKKSPGEYHCSFYAGMFSEIFSITSGIDLSCIEVFCSTPGEKCCRFLLGSAPLIQEVGTKISAGISHNIVLKEVARVY